MLVLLFMKRFVLIFQYGKLLREGDVVVLQLRDPKREAIQHHQKHTKHENNHDERRVVNLDAAAAIQSTQAAIERTRPLTGLQRQAN